MARKPTDTVQLKLRFPEALRRRLEPAATTTDRSMNAEIISRLKQSFERQDNDAFLRWFSREQTAHFVQGMLKGLIDAGALPATAALRLGEIRKLVPMPEIGTSGSTTSTTTDPKGVQKEKK